MDDRARALGTCRTAELSHATVRYWERGEGPPVVFVHGLLVNADLWRDVVPIVAEAGFRCLAPDWPFGAHEIPVPEADLSPPGCAALVGELLERLDLHDVTLVANDTGGAFSQILMAQNPERVSRVVLTSSDSFERFFPPLFAALPLLAKVPGSVLPLVQLLRLRAAQRLPTTFGWLTKRPLPDDLLDSWLVPSRRDPAIRQDLRRFVKAVHRRHTLAAAEGLPAFDKPVLLAWSTEDRVFPISLAHRLAELLPQARVVAIPDSATFAPLDQPTRLAELITQAARDGAA